MCSFEHVTIHIERVMAKAHECMRARFLHLRLPEILVLYLLTYNEPTHFVVLAHSYASSSNYHLLQSPTTFFLSLFSRKRLRRFF